MTPKNPGLTGWSGLTFLALAWGSAFIFIAMAVETIAPSLVVFVRLALGAAMLTGWMVLQSKRFPPLSDQRWLWFAALGGFGNTLPFLLIAIGQIETPSGVAGILMGMTPLIIIVAAHFLLANERLNAWKAAGFLTGFTGIVLLTGPSALTGIFSTSFLSQMLILGATFCYATNTILYQRAPQTDPIVFAAASLLMAAVFALPLAVYDLTFGLELSPSLNSMIGVLMLALLPTALAQMVYMGIARRVGASFVALINYTVPVVAALIGAFYGEPLTTLTWIALAVILFGVFIARRPVR